MTDEIKQDDIPASDVAPLSVEEVHAEAALAPGAQSDVVDDSSAVDTATATDEPAGEPDLTPAFGPMDAVDVNSTEFAVMVMCWNLSAQGFLGERQLVNIASDDEALDILQQQGIPAPVKNDDGLWTTALGFTAGEGSTLINRTQLADKDLRLLAIRALHVKFARWDPEVALVINRFFEVVSRQQAQEQAAKEANVTPEPSMGDADVVVGTETKH